MIDAISTIHRGTDQMWPLKLNADKLVQRIVTAPSWKVALKHVGRLRRVSDSVRAVRLLSDEMRTAFAPASHYAVSALREIGTSEALDEILQALPDAKIGVAEVIIRNLPSDLRAQMLQMHLFVAKDGQLLGTRLGTAPRLASRAIRIRLSLDPNYKTIEYRNGRAIGTSYSTWEWINVLEDALWDPDGKEIKLSDLTVEQVAGLHENLDVKKRIRWGGYRVSWRALSDRHEQLKSAHRQTHESPMATGYMLLKQNKLEEAIIALTKALEQTRDTAGKALVQKLLDQCRERKAGR